jgi:hypothetical protein
LPLGSTILGKCISDACMFIFTKKLIPVADYIIALLM